MMVIGFALLLTITVLAYRNAPPIPAKIVDAHGNTLFTGADISNGQAVFLKYGLMDNGSIWGHGTYLGPDYSAVALLSATEKELVGLALAIFVINSWNRLAIAFHSVTGTY